MLNLKKKGKKKNQCSKNLLSSAVFVCSFLPVGPPRSAADVPGVTPIEETWLPLPQQQLTGKSWVDVEFLKILIFKLSVRGLRERQINLQNAYCASTGIRTQSLERVRLRSGIVMCIFNFSAGEEKKGRCLWVLLPSQLTKTGEFQASEKACLKVQSG